MYKEKFKSPKNPIILLGIWAISVYLFNIMWGISQILFEFNLEFIKYLICIGVTVWFGFNLINKVLTEYEAELTDSKLTFFKNLSRRSKPVFSIAINSIIKIYSDRSCLKNHNISKKANFTLYGTDEPKAYIIYSAGKEEKCVIIEGKKLITKLKKQIKASQN